MSTPIKTDSIRCTTRGQVVIRPETKWAIERVRGLLKRKPGDKPFAQEWAEHKRQERELEERKLARHGA